MAEASPVPDRRLRVLVVDDEPLARRFLRRLLVRDDSVREIRECANGLEAKAEIARAKPDILFLDVEMPALSGAELLGSLPPAGAPVTIFTTAYSEYAIKAFELEACDYLLKPFDEARFTKALARAKALVEASRPAGRTTLAVEAGNRTILLDTDEIVFISSEDNYIKVWVRGRFYLQRTTLSAAEEALKGVNFLRVHRRFLVNVAHVREISRLDQRRLEITLDDGSRAPVSRRYRDRARALVVAC